MPTYSKLQDATRCIKEDAISRVLVGDELWALVEPIRPPWNASSKGSQPRKPDRLCLTGILFVLKTGIPWEDFPQGMGCCGMTLWNRLRQWPGKTTMGGRTHTELAAPVPTTARPLRASGRHP